MKYNIELTTLDDVKEFTQRIQTAEGEVRLSGKDEHGSAWNLSAKSALCVFLLGGHIQHILHADQNIDWNTVVCECDASVYTLIKRFIKE